MYAITILNITSVPVHDVAYVLSFKLKAKLYK